MSAIGPFPVPRTPARRGGHVVRTTCPDCGRELASATYTARELVDLHRPTCLGSGGGAPSREGDD